MAEHRWVVLDLLDRQIIDSTQQPVAKVDDVELRPAADGGPPRVAALLWGAEALGQRLGGLLGRSIAGTARRMRTGPPGPRRVEWARVAEWRYVLKLDGSVQDLELTPALEAWMRQHVIAPLPGSGDARS